MARRHPLLREALLCAAAAASVAAVLAWLGPPGTDLAAHAYQRTLFLEHGFVLWNNFWYAGRYSFVTYSLVYYPLAALFGIRLLAVATIALAALAFAVVVWREWGPTTRWSSRSFAVVWAGIVLSAAFPFALGIAFALLAIWALQAGRRWRFAALAVLTLAASPLAFLLLVVVLAAIVLARRAPVRENWLPIVAIVIVSAAELVLWRLFPAGGRYPFSLAEAAAGAVFCGLGLACTWRLESARVLRYVFAIYLAAGTAAYLVPSAVGENIARLRYLAIPLAILVMSLRHWKPLLPVLGVLALAVSWNLTPLASSYVNSQSDVTATAKAWPAAIHFLHYRLGRNYRVEAVDTRGHWPAVYLADAGIPLARGWFRQDDFPQNQLLYSKLGPAQYLAWLRGLGVRFVILSDAPPDYSSRAEATLVASGRAGLVPVLATQSLTIYEVPNAQPILTGPGDPRIESLTESRMTVSVAQAGRYRLAVRWSPYWRASSGCLTKGKDGMLRLVTFGPADVQLRFDVNAERALDELTGIQPRCAAP